MSQVLRRPMLLMYRLSTRGAHSSLREKGTLTRLKRARLSYLYNIVIQGLKDLWVIFSVMVLCNAIVICIIEHGGRRLGFPHATAV